MRFNVKTSSRDLRCFEIEPHLVSTPEDFFLDPKLFYAPFPQGIPALPHHEMEILVPSKDFLLPFKGQHIVHVHYSERTGAPFVCWTGRLKDLAEARLMLELWTVGAAASIRYGRDLLGGVFGGECGGTDRKKFFRIMKERFETELLSDEVTDEHFWATNV